MRKLLNLLPVGVISALGTIFIIYASLAANPMDVNEVHLFKGADKVIHFLMYFILTILYSLDYANYKYPHHTHRSKLILFTAIACTLGIIMECLQGIMDLGRSMDVYDGICNILGGICAYLLIRYRLMKIYRNIMRGHRHRHHHKH